MPLPFLFIGAAAATGLAGVGKTIKAGMDNSEAKSINEAANNRIEEAGKQLDQSRKDCGTSLEVLGKEKLAVLNGSIKDFINEFEKIKNIEFSNSVGLDELHKIHFDKKSFEELKKLNGFASSFIGGAVSGVAGGAFTAFGAYSAATTFATASTGTAIASLSGAAASNATLAFFGGGSLAAGGLGIAGGTAVLGGLVAGPALLVTGMITGAKAEKNLEEARTNLAKANEICEELKTAMNQCRAIRRRTYMFYNLLARADAYFTFLVYLMRQTIRNEGEDYALYSMEGKKIIAMTASMAGTIKAIMDTAILTEEGNLTNSSEVIAENLLEEIEERDKNFK